MLFQAPVGDILNWDDAKIAGITRWFARIHKMSHALGDIPETTADQIAAEVRDRSRVGGTWARTATEWQADAAVWRAVQTTIPSVRAAYTSGYALNTVVSDLMRLANVLGHEEARAGYLKQALGSLLRMLAPIAPAFSEECWSILHPGLPSLLSSQAFPEPDGTLSQLPPPVQKVPVQVDGKLRCVVEIPQLSTAALEGDELRDWVVERILDTEEGKARLITDKIDVRKATRVVLVGGGKLVNFVFKENTAPKGGRLKTKENEAEN